MFIKVVILFVLIFVQAINAQDSLLADKNIFTLNYGISSHSDTIPTPKINGHYPVEDDEAFGFSPLDLISKLSTFGIAYDFPIYLGNFRIWSAFSSSTYDYNFLETYPSGKFYHHNQYREINLKLALMNSFKLGYFDKLPWEDYASLHYDYMVGLSYSSMALKYEVQSLGKESFLKSFLSPFASVGVRYRLFQNSNFFTSFRIFYDPRNMKFLTNLPDYKRQYEIDRSGFGISFGIAASF